MYMFCLCGNSCLKTIMNKYEGGAGEGKKRDVFKALMGLCSSCKVYPCKAMWSKNALCANNIKACVLNVQTWECAIGRPALHDGAEVAEQYWADVDARSAECWWWVGHTVLPWPGPTALWGEQCPHTHLLQHFLSAYERYELLRADIVSVCGKYRLVGVAA